MKKYRILAFILILAICSSAFLISCDNGTSYSLSDIMNSKCKTESKGVISTQFQRVYYTDRLNKADDGFSFWWDYETIDTTPYLTHYTHNLVYSASSSTPILTIKDLDSLNDSKNSQDMKQWIYFDAISSEYLAVLTQTVIYNYGYGTSTYILNIYDSSGNIIATINEDEIRALNGSCVPEYYSNYVANNSTAELYRYRTDKIFKEKLGVDFELWVGEGKVCCFDSNNRISLVNNYSNESKPLLEYMQKFGDNYLETANGVYSVYDKDLNKTIEYEIPEGRDIKAFVLENGNLLVQYLRVIGKNERKYDVISYANEKMELVTRMVTAQGVTELEDVDYIIDTLEPSYVDYDGKKVYSDNVENLALVYNINAKKNVDYNYKKLILIDNNGLMNGKVETDVNIDDFPKQYTDDYYSVKLNDERYAIYDKKGDMVGIIDSNIMHAEKLCNEYVLAGKKIIYNSLGEKVCDLSDKKDLKILKCGNTIIIKYFDNGTNYDIFVDGEFKFIGSSADPDFGFRSDPDSCIQYSDLLGYSEKYGYYTVRRKEKNGYMNYLYNIEGELFARSEDTMNVFVSNDDALVMRNGYDFYMFKIK